MNDAASGPTAKSPLKLANQRSLKSELLVSALHRPDPQHPPPLAAGLQVHAAALRYGFGTRALASAAGSSVMRGTRSTECPRGGRSALIGVYVRLMRS
jgi:hypothetical protein